MPYADPAKQRAAAAEWYRKQYARREFKRAEAARKAEWLKTETGQQKNAEASKRARQKKATAAPPAKSRRRRAARTP